MTAAFSMMVYTTLQTKLCPPWKTFCWLSYFQNCGPQEPQIILPILIFRVT